MPLIKISPKSEFDTSITKLKNELFSYKNTSFMTDLFCD